MLLIQCTDFTSVLSIDTLKVVKRGQINDLSGLLDEVL